MTIIELLSGDIPLRSCTLCDSTGCCEFLISVDLVCFHDVVIHDVARFKAVKFSTEYKRIWGEGDSQYIRAGAVEMEDDAKGFFVFLCFVSLCRYAAQIDSVPL